MEVGSVLAATDKFRGSASAAVASRAAADGAMRAGWCATRLPLSDGGEGFLDAFVGERRTETVVGPNGEPVRADWLLVREHQLAVVEVARAVGLSLVGGAENNDPVGASTRGVGELVLAAARAGVREVIIGCGGSATTDGGAGAVDVLGPRLAETAVALRVATDVETTFLDAASIFAPQKGATYDEVSLLSGRLARLAQEYRCRFGIDVSAMPGSGAAGGLAGGLAALGAEICSGFELVASRVRLDAALADVDVVITGEGLLDRTSLEGKVVGGILQRVAGRVPVLIVAGAVSADALGALRENYCGPLCVVSLSELYGMQMSLADAPSLIGQVATDFLTALPPLEAKRR